VRHGRERGARVLQPSFDFSVRDAARATDDVTSVMAAERAARHASFGRMLALRLHYEYPEGLTDFELAELSGWQQTSIGKRRNDLMNPKYFSPVLVEKTEHTRPSPSGSPARVWRITEAGINYYARECVR
jgi:hypothetical protein